MKRVLLFTTDLEVGGTPTVVRELARRLPGEGLEVRVACLGRFGPVAEQIQNDGAPVAAFDVSALRLPQAVRRLRRLVEATEVDAVLSFLVHANVVAALASSKGVRGGGVRWLQSIQTTQPYPWWHWKLQGWSAARAERLIVPSRGIVEAAGRLAGIRPDRFEIIPNAIDAAQVVDAPRPARAAGSVLRVGYLGRLDPVKNVPDLVEAVRRLPGVELHIFGDGPDRPRIEQAAGGDSHITLHGTVDREVALSQIDVLCLPSMAEGFGLVLIEAMAAGVPVIASDIPGVREVVDHQRTGYLVRHYGFPDDLLRIHTSPSIFVRPLRNMLAWVRDHPDEAYVFAAAALEDVKRRFTWDRIIPRYRALLDGNAPG